MANLKKEWRKIKIHAITSWWKKWSLKEWKNIKRSWAEKIIKTERIRG